VSQMKLNNCFLW